MAKLTARSVESWKPDPAKRQEVPDAYVPGLYLIVQPSGRKGWAIRYRHRGKPKKLSLGTYPGLSLADARTGAGEKMKLVERGIDPASEKAAARAAARTVPTTFGDVADEFLKRHVSHLAPRTQDEYRRAVDKVLRPRWADDPVTDLTRREIIAALDEIGAERGPVAANRSLAVLQTLLNWAVTRDLLDVSPAANIRDPNPEKPRQRTLADDELRVLWPVLDAYGEPFGPWAKILLLTAARREEAAKARWVDLDLEAKLWRMPDTKSDRPHVVPLSDAAVDVFAAIRRGKAGPFVFSTTDGRTAISGYSRVKARIDKRITEALAEEDPAAEPLAGWTWHDLRRTCRTGLSRLGVAPHVAELVLGHAVGGLIKVYDQHDFLAEKRAALDAWADFVGGLVGGDRGNVVELAQVRR